MEESKVIVGDTYTFESPLLTHPFSGKVLNKLEHSVIAEIDQFDPSDANIAKDLQYKTVVGYSAMSTL